MVLGVPILKHFRVDSFGQYILYHYYLSMLLNVGSVFVTAKRVFFTLSGKVPLFPLVEPVSFINSS